MGVNMEIDRKTNLILKHTDIYETDPNYKMMVDNTQFLDAESVYRSFNFVDSFYGSVKVDEAERDSHGS
jgi:hypothetical protein